MSFVRMIFGKPAEEIRLSDIQALIDNKVEESHHLEYKSGQILKKREQLSEWVSAFLNAEGGLIVIGVTEDDHTKKNRLDARIYPEAIDYALPGFTRERVDQIIHTNIRGDDVPHVAIFPVRGNANNCVYLIDVPQGEAPPYQAADGKYYRRLNFTKHTMRHYEIADFFGRRRKPALHLHAQVTEFDMADNLWRLTLRLFISNEGRAVAKYIQFTTSFVNGVISDIVHGDLFRLDDLRHGVPSVQWTGGDNVLHPRRDRRTRFAELRLAQNDPSQPVTLDWDLVAEDFGPSEGRFQFDDELFDRLAAGDRPYIRLPANVSHSES